MVKKWVYDSKGRNTKELHKRGKHLLKTRKYYDKYSVTKSVGRNMYSLYLRKIIVKRKKIPYKRNGRYFKSGKAVLIWDL